MTHRARALLVVAGAIFALASPAGAFAQTRLIGTVGTNDAHVISLTHPNGSAVTDVAAGTYEIEVRDRSEMHNFHLTGPGVNMTTTVGFTGTVTWTVTVRNASRYTYVCDVHSGDMRGTFTTGGGPPPPPPPPPPPRVQTLTATVGPGATISLRTARGARVTRLKAGRYRIRVSDRSAMHNFHLVGPGVNKKTTVRFRGTTTWTVTFRKSRTYRYVCDAHAKRMRGSFRTT